jgi:nucleoside-diphosphate-sugar epimerase
MPCCWQRIAPLASVKRTTSRWQPRDLARIINALADVADLPHPTRSYSHSTASTLAGLWEGYYRLLGRTQRPPMTRLMVELMGTDQDFPIVKAQQGLGYRPRVSFEEGIRYTADWLRQGKLLETD